MLGSAVGYLGFGMSSTPEPVATSPAPVAASPIEQIQKLARYTAKASSSGDGARLMSALKGNDPSSHANEALALADLERERIEERKKHSWF